MAGELASLQKRWDRRGSDPAADTVIETVDVLLAPANRSRIVGVLTHPRDAADRSWDCLREPRNSNTVWASRRRELKNRSCSSLIRRSISAAMRSLRLLNRVEVNVQQPGLLGPLHGSHPEQRIGDAREHHVFPRRTQVSLLPPPCDEFTTIDSALSATRVSPPGTMMTLSPS